MKSVFFFLSAIAVLLFASVLACNALPGIPLCPAVSSNALVLGSGAIHLFLISTALLFLLDPDLKAMFKKLGFPGGLLNTLLYTVGGLVAVFAALFIISFALFMLGVNDQGKVVDKISGLPVYILLFAVFFAPFSEELFFRGFLVPRIGIIGSAALFAVSHITYGSIAEIAGVLTVGLILGAVFKYSKSITPCILIHLIYNGISIAAIKLIT